MLRGYKLTERGKILVALIIVFIMLLTSAILALRALAASKTDRRSSGNETDAFQPPTAATSGISTHDATGTTPPAGGDFVSQNGTTPATGAQSPENSPTAAPATSTPQPAQTPSESPSLEPLTTDTTGNSDSIGTPDTTNNHNTTVNVDGADDNNISDKTNNANNPDLGGANELPSSQKPGISGGNPLNGTLSFFFSPSVQVRLDSETESMLESFLNSSSNTLNNMIIVETPRLSDKDSEILMDAVKNAFAPLGISTLRLSHTPRSYLNGGSVFEVNLYYTPGVGK